MASRIHYELGGATFSLSGCDPLFNEVLCSCDQRGAGCVGRTLLMQSGVTAKEN